MTRVFDARRRCCRCSGVVRHRHERDPIIVCVEKCCNLCAPASRHTHTRAQPTFMDIVFTCAHDIIRWGFKWERGSASHLHKCIVRIQSPPTLPPSLPTSTCTYIFSHITHTHILTFSAFSLPYVHIVDVHTNLPANQPTTTHSKTVCAGCCVPMPHYLRTRSRTNIAPLTQCAAH